MITRTHRFHGHNTLRHVYSRGQTVRGQLMAIRYYNNPRRQTYRAAVVVSRKVHKSAVVRGRIRRRTYEVIRLSEPHLQGPFDIVITAYSPQLAIIPAAELYDQLTTLLQRARILRVPQSGGDDSHAIVEQIEARAGQHTGLTVDKREQD